MGDDVVWCQLYRPDARFLDQEVAGQGDKFLVGDFGVGCHIGHQAAGQGELLVDGAFQPVANAAGFCQGLATGFSTLLLALGVVDPCSDAQGKQKHQDGRAPGQPSGKMVQSAGFGRGGCIARSVHEIWAGAWARTFMPIF